MKSWRPRLVGLVIAVVTLGVLLHLRETGSSTPNTRQVSAHGKSFEVVGQPDGTVIFNTPKQKYCNREVHACAIKIVAISPDQKWVVVGDEIGSCSLWRTNTGEFVRYLLQPPSELDSVSQVVWSPDNRWVTTAGEGEMHTPYVRVVSIPSGDSYDLDQVPLQVIGERAGAMALARERGIWGGATPFSPTEEFVQEYHRQAAKKSHR